MISGDICISIQLFRNGRRCDNDSIRPFSLLPASLALFHEQFEHVFRFRLLGRLPLLARRISGFVGVLVRDRRPGDLLVGSRVLLV